MARIAVVTGAAGGLGRAISAKLLADGMQVVGLDIDAAGLSDMADAGFQRPRHRSDRCCCDLSRLRADLKGSWRRRCFGE